MAVTRIDTYGELLLLTLEQDTLTRGEQDRILAMGGEDEQEEIDIIEGDTQDKEEAERKAEEARKAAAAAQYHTIKQGDTLGALAVKYHTTVKKLCQLNGISERTVLRLGRKIRVK